jgi:outer membrane receptor for ferric coprogen and ferric-rhodotorulic acid
MKHPVRGSVSAVIASLLLFHESAFAQMSETPASGSPAADTANQKEEVIVLSPFQVSAEMDDGFVASSSHAGGRLSTELKDTPVAYSVITRDFLDALGLFDTEKAMTWSVGSYMPLQDTSSYRYNDGEANSSVMSRGLRIAGAQQRNFFQLGMNSDTYSQERIDFARGPNALLIGTSGLGGTVIGMTKRANADRSFNRASVLLGSWNKFRAALDVNRPLTKNVAIRINALWQDANTWRDLEFDNRRGVHLAGTWHLSRRTQFRAEYEHYQQRTIMGRETMSDGVSGWDGQTVVTAPTAAVANSDAKGIARMGSSTSPYMVYVPGSDANTVINWANTWRTQGGGANASVPVGGVLPLSTANLNINNGPFLGNVYDMDALYHLAEAGSMFRRPSDKTVIQPNAPTLSYGFDSFALFVEHQQGDHLFFEAAGTHVSTEKQVEAVASRMGTGHIDVNQTLPNGQPNPNFKQIYSDSIFASYFYKNEITEGRVAAAYVLDNTRWGDFRANLIAGARKVDNEVLGYNFVMDRDPDIRRRAQRDFFNYRYYWNQLDSSLNVPDQIHYVDPVAGKTTTYNVDKILDLRSPGNFRKSDTTFTYLQAALNAKLLKGRLNLIAGARKDALERNLYTMNGSANSVAADYPVNWDGQTAYYRSLAPADYWNLTYRTKDAGGNVTNPTVLQALSRPRDANGVPLSQYANDRFRDDFSSPPIDVDLTTFTYGGVGHVLPWLSVYANYAESFNPPGAGITINGGALPPGYSDGWDAGLRFILLNGRINASFGRYSSIQKNNSFDNTGQTRKYANIAAANVVGNQDPNGLNNRGLAEVPSPTFDFRDQEANGFEIDIVANLTKNWRLSANAGIPKTLTTNNNQEQWAYLKANEATLKQIVLDAGVLIDANNVATVDTSIPVGNRSPDVTAAATAWNDIQNFKKTDDPTIKSYSDQPKFTANLYTDYRFASGKLKNFRVGGGVQYIGRKAIGNRGGDTIVNPANPLAAIDDPNVDAGTRVYMPAYYTVTATFGYEHKFANKSVLNVALNVGNLLDEDRLVYIGAGLRAPNGDISRPDRVTVPTSFLYLQPRSYSLTATFSF